MGYTYNLWARLWDMLYPHWNSRMHFCNSYQASGFCSFAISSWVRHIDFSWGVVLVEAVIDTSSSPILFLLRLIAPIYFEILYWPWFSFDSLGTELAECVAHEQVKSDWEGLCHVKSEPNNSRSHLAGDVEPGAWNVRSLCRCWLIEGQKLTPIWCL